MLSNNLEIESVKEIILSLTCTDYYSGPEADHNGEGFVVVFKKDYCNKTLYIKLKIEEELGIEKLKCLSLHEDETL